MNKTDQTIANFFAEMDFIMAGSFSAIPKHELEVYADVTVFYVYDVTEKGVVTHQTKGLQHSSVFAFVSQIDAETWKEIGTTAADFQDHVLEVNSELFGSLKDQIAVEFFGEIDLLLIDDINAQRLFALYPESLRSIEYRKSSHYPDMLDEYA